MGFPVQTIVATHVRASSLLRHTKVFRIQQISLYLTIPALLAAMVWTKENVLKMYGNVLEEYDCF